MNMKMDLRFLLALLAHPGGKTYNKSMVAASVLPLNMTAYLTGHITGERVAVPIV